MAIRGSKGAFLRVPSHIGDKARQQAKQSFIERVERVDDGSAPPSAYESDRLEERREERDGGKPLPPSVNETEGSQGVVSRLPYAHRRVWADSVLRTERAFHLLAARDRAAGAQRWRRNEIARLAGINSAQTLDEAVRVLIGLGLVRRRSLRGPQGAEFELLSSEMEPSALARRLAARLRRAAALLEGLEPEAWRERAVIQVIERIAAALAVFEETPQFDDAL